MNNNKSLQAGGKLIKAMEYTRSYFFAVFVQDVMTIQNLWNGHTIQRLICFLGQHEMPSKFNCLFPQAPTHSTVQ